jgi:hypothetical protein
MAGYHTFESPKSQAMIVRIVDELSKHPMTRDELQCLLRVSKATMQRYVVHLRGGHRIHISEWRSSGLGRFAPVFSVGRSKDAPEPAGPTRSARNAAIWQQIKRDRELHERIKAAARVHGAIRRVRAAPQSWFAALPGAKSLTLEAA